MKNPLLSTLWNWLIVEKKNIKKNLFKNALIEIIESVVGLDLRVFIDLTARECLSIYKEIIVIWNVEPIKAKIIAITSFIIELDKIKICFKC